MTFQVSPGVNVREIDLTTIVPASSTTAAGFAGAFKWGALNEVTLVSSELELIEKFGKPDTDTAPSWFSAANFLSYGNRLRLVRIADETAALNATTEATTGSGTAGTGLLVKNDEHYENNYADGSANVGEWIARHPGALGNSLRVSTCPSVKAFGNTLAGTLSSSGTAVTGTTTSFETELEVGSILIMPDGSEIKVTAITSDTALTLASAPDTALSSDTVVCKWEYADQIGVAPGTSDFVSARAGSLDELHVIVVDEDGAFTGVPGSILERFAFVSKASDAKNESGASNYYVEVINRTSDYVRWADHTPTTNYGTAAANTTFTTPDAPSSFSFAGGADGNSTVDSADKIAGFDLFKDKEQVDVSLMITGEAEAATALHVIENICEYRKDCIAFISPEKADVVDNPGSEVTDSIAFRNSLTSSSYAVMDNNWKYQYDKYNDTYRWVPVNADIAGLCVRTDTERDAWWSPAGLNRGHIKSTIKLAYNPTKAQRDDLYVKGINPVVQFPGEGTVLYGDKTLLNKPSAFDRINVRRLFIILEKSISEAAKYSLFEFNDDITRAQFKNMVDPFLADVQGRRGIYDYRVVCDTTNNTPEVIDRNEFIGDIYIKPARSINFIRLNFVAVRTGVDFEIVVGQF